MARTISFSSAIPVLQIFSEELAHAFYVDFLGFQVDWRHRNEMDRSSYMQVSRDGFLLHLTEHDGGATQGSRVFVATAGLDALLGELRARDHDRLRPAIEETPWGSRVLNLVDPFGNRLAFHEPGDEPG